MLIKVTLCNYAHLNVVFYVDSTKLHGLIVAFQNQGRVAWYNGEFTVTQAKGRAIGTGAEKHKKNNNFPEKRDIRRNFMCIIYRGRQ